MVARSLVVALAMILLVTGCNKKKATTTGTESYTYIFQDDFNRADGSFTSETDYYTYPSASVVAIDSMRVKSNTSFAGVAYNTAVTTDPAGTIATFAQIGGTGSSFAFVTRSSTSNLGSATHIMYCGFNFTSTLELFDDGGSVVAGSTAFTFPQDVEVTLLLTKTGSAYTCSASDGTNTETINYTDTSPFTQDYHGFYFGYSGSNYMRADDFGIVDLSSRSARALETLIDSLALERRR